MTDYSEIPPFSPLQPESPGIPDLSGLHPATVAPTAFTPTPIYPQRVSYANFDPASQRPSLPFTHTPRQINRGRPTIAMTTSSMEQRAGSEPTTGWCRRHTQLNTRHISLPRALEGALWSLRDRLPSPNRPPSPDRSPTPVQNIHKTTEAEGDPVAALHWANNESQRIINREMDARIALEDNFEKLQRRNALLEVLYGTFRAADGLLQQQRDDAVHNQHLAEKRVNKLKGDLAKSQRERLHPDGNCLQQPAGVEHLQDERDVLELERDHYMDLAHQRLIENQSLQDQVTELNIQLQATRAQAIPRSVDPSPIASPTIATPSFSPLSAASPPIKPPPSSSHNSPLPTAQRHSSIDNDAAPPANAVRGSRGGRGRGAGRGRAGRRGRGAGMATREKRERACKVKKNYKV